MDLKEVLKIEDVNIEQLQKGLMHIGLNLSKFETIQEEQIANLMLLFKSAININPHTTSKFTKMDLRSKLERTLKVQSILTNDLSSDLEEPKIIEKVLYDTDNAVIKSTKNIKEIGSLQKNQIKNFSESKSNNKSKSKDAHLGIRANRKLGKVKFFDAGKGFGYVSSFIDNKECFVHASKLITTNISEDDIVIFETINSQRKPGELDAIQVSNKIPLFIYNKENIPFSFAYTFLNKELNQEVVLTEKYETGFAVVTARSTSVKWNIVNLPTEKIQERDCIAYGTKILLKLLPNLYESINSIEWLILLLGVEVKQIDLQTKFNELLNNLEQKTILDINKEIKILKSITVLQVFFEEKKKTLNKISFVLWTQGEFEQLPNLTTQDEINTWIVEILPTLNWQVLQDVLTKLNLEQGATKLVEEAYKFLIQRGWHINNKEELKIIITFLRTFKLLFPLIKLEESNYTCKKNQYYINLYDEGFINDLSDTRIKGYIEELKFDEEKANFIEKLPSDKILSIYNDFPVLSTYQNKYINGLLETEIFKVDFICFDLEIDGSKIKEYAWKNNLGITSETDFFKPEEGISALINLLNSGTLIIGQNIKEFDLPILKNYGASPSNNIIWDTLEIEMLLNPNRFSYGLKTEHTAKEDTINTFNLFINQLCRIITEQLDIKYENFFSLEIINILNTLRESGVIKKLNPLFFVIDSNKFFRPNPTHQNISEQTFNQLSKKIKEEGNKVIIAPEFLWNTLSHQFDLTFYSDSTSFGFCFNKEKIELILSKENLLKFILFRFVDSYFIKGLQPYFLHLPIAIRLKLTSEQVTLICDNIDVTFEGVNNKPICIKPTDIEILKQYANKISDLKVIIVGSELYNLTSKLQLGQDLDFATIFDKLKKESIWMQMSGGKSFITLGQNHCRLLGIMEFPEFVKNIWLEKIARGKFKVWCNLNFEECIKNLPVKKAYYIEWVDETFIKSNSFIIKPDARNSGYIAEQKRVNPESLYRKIYWVYQFKLFGGISTKNYPKVLLINDELEIEKLSAYARRIGYFIPDTNASLTRQIELLHAHKSTNKVLIASLQNLGSIILSNYIGPIDFIWDSFLLHEKLQMLKGNILPDLLNSEEQKEDDYQTDINSIQKDYDIFSLIKLHKPLIDYYYKMLYDNNQDSQLFLCDTRLTDYNGIEKSLNLNAKSVQMWYKEDDYNRDNEIASDFFSSVHENADSDFNIDEAKEIIRQIFLIPEEGGDPYPWHDYQHPCLNEILPAKKDLLISLPTGAGKSLLFQGPALFRSAFSSKLSLIVSPLRALMQDQVDALWDKGFYSNVEFLSGDKSQVEIRDIYRRISGGEITLLYITPERFRSRAFENSLLTRLDADNGLEYVVFDEAHCISQWGQEFRPDYLNAGKKIADYSGSYQMRKLLFSATISEQVFDEISIIMPGINTIEGTAKSYNPVRDHIKMDFKHNVIDEERLVEIAKYLKSGKFNPKLSRAIIFVKSRKKVDACSLLMSDSLKGVFGVSCNFADKVGAFHAGMDAEDRRDIYDKYKSGEIIILFATKAFGMGMDIPNIHFVTHYSPPSTFEDFLQEVGRAGRNEKQRLEAGFSNEDNPIKTLCLTAKNDFAKLKDQLHKSRISWHEVIEIKKILEEYIERFQPLKIDLEIPVAVPFNLYSNEKGSVNDDLDNKFRIALHWLEKLDRIKLGYFTITHLEFDTASLLKLGERLNKCPDKDCEKVCLAIIELMPPHEIDSEVIQLSVASLRNTSRLSLSNLFIALLKNHKLGILKLLQDVVIEPTKMRLDETKYYKDADEENEKYPALQVVFAMASKILGSVPSNSSKFFEGEELDRLLNESLTESINFTELPWPINSGEKYSFKNINNYVSDIQKKRSKHAFTIIRLLGKTKHETKMEKVIDGSRKIYIKQSLFNGYHKKNEWSTKIYKLKQDCIKLLDFVGSEYFKQNKKTFNWPDIIVNLNLKGNVQYLSDLLYILSVLGYCITGGLLPSGIEVYLNSTEDINEKDLQSNDKKIFDEFEDTRKVRELKLIALEVLGGFQKQVLNNDEPSIRKKQDIFIRKYFGCSSLADLLQLLHDELPPNDPLLAKWRGDAIKTEEERLNVEQRRVYDADINQHINVMAGPGSGKTHTLTLRVAKLIHHIGTNPEEILVLAYNRSVVSELKERLGKLFNELGYGSLAKRIKIFTFHGLAKRYCQNEIEGRPFEDWESILLNQLNIAPGQIMNQLAPLKHILVDEFQDINRVRIDLLNKLHELTNSCLFIIGDPNQSIYGYERIKEGGSMSPWPYYENFNALFNPKEFELYDNHRSYPDILKLASQILELPEEHQHLIPKATRMPDENFITNYAQVIDRTVERADWWDQISILMEEKVGNQSYKQIAILFRTNNEVYRGFQKIKGLNLPNVRIRIQGSLPYEFTRIRECHAVLRYLKSKIGQQIPLDFKQSFLNFINELILQYIGWNQFYIRVMHTLVLEFLEEQDEDQLFDNLLEFITELTYKDDGQLYKIYEKHLDKSVGTIQETEIVLTTMHKVKGLEFDCVIIPPSFSNLPLRINQDATEVELLDQLDEEKRLAFVAYTRARYRLVIIKHSRENALDNNRKFKLPETSSINLGIPVHPEIKKLNIGWAAREFNFAGVHNFIDTSISSGDFVYIKCRIVANNGHPFTVHEIYKEGTTNAIGLLSKDAGPILRHSKSTGFVVNEVVVWSYEDSVKSDSENGTNYANNWCAEARNQGYIYLVDFAGFGKPEE